MGMYVSTGDMLKVKFKLGELIEYMELHTVDFVNSSFPGLVDVSHKNASYLMLQAVNLVRLMTSKNPGNSFKRVDVDPCRSAAYRITYKK